MNKITEKNSNICTIIEAHTNVMGCLKFAQKKIKILTFEAQANKH